uniref:CapA family protein n=1 Tax=Ornithinicoccus halotolerans TaxID=1748220 RepID=UPI0012970E56
CGPDTGGPGAPPTGEAGFPPLPHDEEGTAGTGPTATAARSGGHPPSGTAASPSPPPAPTGEAGGQEPVAVLIGAGGDILPHAAVITSAAAHAERSGSDLPYDFAPMFAPVRDVLTEPDLALCHLETPVSADNTALTEPGSLSFSSPRELPQGLADTGFDACELASNHALDRGLEGLAATREQVRAAGLGWSGPPHREQAARQIPFHDAGAARVAHLVYSYTLFNSGSPNTDVPAEAPWLRGSLWPAVGAQGVLEDAARARRQGADFVVVTMHWGTEYQVAPTDEQRELARELLGSDDVDLVVGSHAHLVQPCETIDGKLVAYGLGNLLSNQSPDTTGGDLSERTQEGVLLQVRLTREADGSLQTQARFIPTRVDLDGHVVRPVGPDHHPASHQRTVETLHALGPDACAAAPRPG